MAMLLDDLGLQHHAFDAALEIDRAEDHTARDLLSALLLEFDPYGYSRDPLDAVFALGAELIKESITDASMKLELFALDRRAWESLERRSPVAEADRAVREYVPSLGLLPNSSVRRTRGHYVQLPAEPGKPGPRIPEASVLLLAMRAGNASRWRKIAKNLGRIDVLSEGQLEIDRLNWRGFEFSDVTATQEVLVATVTAPIGWDARGTFAGSVTSPYMTYRRLKFTRFWVETIVDVVTFLNRVTGDAAIYPGETFQFRVKGLPTPEDLTTAMLDVRGGKVALQEVQDRFLYPKYSRRDPESARDD